MKNTRVVVTGLLLALQPVAWSAAPARSLADLSLEELAEIRITSVSREPERLSEAAASIYVITADDIRRAGVTTLPEALRLAPNLQVARADAGQYAISARGFNNAIGNKLLVLIDGRTVYAPFFSGVVWDQQDLMLEDIDRIEVVSGPGATLWGTNAVNGVINVVTRPAAQSQGALLVAGGGNRESRAAARYGGRWGTDTSFRLYAQSSRQQNTETAAGAAVADGWVRHLVGFRLDGAAAGGAFMLQGQALRGRSEDRGALGAYRLGPLEILQADLLGQWTRTNADGSDWRVQAYYDHSDRTDRLLYQPKESIVDVEAQHGFALGPHRVVWGGGYRRARDDIQPGFFFGFVPETRTLSWASLFAQGTFRLDSRMDLTLGARVERNDYTGTELLPSARWAWKFTGEQLLWAAASRAVRAPARLDRDIRLPPQPPYLIAGGPDFIAEVAKVYELGYRAQPARSLSVSFTAFHQGWDRLRSGQPPPNAQVQNMIDGHSSGVEAWGSWQPASWWRLTAGFTTLHKNLRLKPGSTDPVGTPNLGNDPDSQWQLRAAFDLAAVQTLDLGLRRVSALPNPEVPAYTALDLRYAWQATDTVELSLVLRNLLDPVHPEFGGAGRSEIGRAGFLQLKLSL